MIHNDKDDILNVEVPYGVLYIDGKKNNGQFLVIDGCELEIKRRENSEGKEIYYIYILGSKTPWGYGNDEYNHLLDSYYYRGID